MMIVLADRVLHRINDGVACDVNVVWISPLTEKVRFGKRSRGEVVLRNDRHSFTIKLLWVWAVYVVCS